MFEGCGDTEAFGTLELRRTCFVKSRLVEKVEGSNNGVCVDGLFRGRDARKARVFMIVEEVELRQFGLC